MAIWPCPNVLHWEHCCRGPGLILLSFILKGFLSCFQFLWYIQCGSNLFFSRLPGAYLLLALYFNQRRWVEYWLVATLFPLNISSAWLFALFYTSLQTFCSSLQYHQNYYNNSFIITTLFDMPKNSTVLMLLAWWGLNRKIPCCWLGVSHCPIPSFCSLLFKARSCRNLGTGGSSLCAAPSAVTRQDWNFWTTREY